MAAEKKSTEILRFGIFELDQRTGELRKQGKRIKLQDQPFRVLSALLQQPGEVITREELRSHIWPQDTFVDFDNSLNTAINKLREALGDSADSPRFIETLPRRGYRFLVPVGSDEERPIKRSFGSKIALGALISVLLAATTWFVFRRLHYSIETKQRRLTANHQDNPVLGSVISPDGKYLTFADKTGFYLRQIDSGETHAVSLPQGFNAFPSAWYPDGIHLIATRVEEPKSPSSLWQVSITGGTPRKLIDDGGNPSVSRSGSKIAFVRGQDRKEELWVMDGNGENPIRLLSAPENVYFGVPAWSPDGKHIAFVRSTYLGQWTFKSTVERFDLASGHNEIIVSSPTASADHNAQLGLGLAWTSDNQLIYSVSELSPNQGDANLWSIRLDSDGRAAGRALRLTNTPDGIFRLSSSDDGSRIAYIKYSVNASTYISELSEGNRLSTPLRLTLDDWKDIPFAWTPDSRAVIFVSDRDGPFHIYKQLIDQAVPELLVGGNEQANIPRLAPDDSTLIYVSWPKQGEATAPTRIMRVPVVGGPSQTVVRGQGIGNIQCSRPPANICVYDEASATQLFFFRFDIATGKSEELPQFRIEDAPQSYGWNLSPDGKFLVVMKAGDVQKDPHFTLCSLENGSKREVIIKARVEIAGIDFAIDGKSLWAAAFTSTGKWTLLNIDLEGQTHPVLEDQETSIDWAIPSPDGKRLALSKASWTSNVWLLQRF